MNISPQFKDHDESLNVQNIRSQGIYANAVTADKERPEEADAPLLVIIDSRVLDRECLAHGLTVNSVDMSIATFSSYEQWQHQRRNRKAAAVLYHIGGQKVSDPAVGNYLKSLVASCMPAPIILLADKEEIAQVVRALEYGVKGYIPTSVNVTICVKALRLAMAGGTFVPASSVLVEQRIGIVPRFRGGRRENAAFGRHVHPASGRSRQCASAWQGQQDHRL